MASANHQNSFSTAQMIGNSFDLINDYQYNPDTDIHYQSNNNPVQDQPPALMSCNPQAFDLTTQSPENMNTDDLDGDFIPVTYKKQQKQMKHNSTNHLGIYPDDQQPQLRQQQRLYTASNNPSLSRNNQRVITNSKFSQHNQQQESNQNHQIITTAATRYAQTRFPFPPYIIRFSASDIKEKQAAEEISLHFKNHHQTEISFSNYRISTTKCIANEYDILLYVKDVDSFTNLYDKNKWPDLIGSKSYSFSSMPSIPPQLALIIKNVDLRTDMQEFTEDLKNKYPDIKNVVRLKNKLQQDIRMIKIELLSSLTRNKILSMRKINVNYLSFDVEEYLAPASVLICSKCCGLGHFKRQCTQANDTCKTCGETVINLKQHSCTNNLKCIHCGGLHLSNASTCPVIKQFRAELTKKLLSTNQAKSTNLTYKYDQGYYPQLNPQPNVVAGGSNYGFIAKLDDMMNMMTKINENIDKITKCNDKFEKFMHDKIEEDKIICQDINLLKNQDKILEANQVQHELKLKRHDNILIKLFMPLVDEMAKVILSLNHDQHGHVSEPGLRTKFEIIRKQMKLAMDGKDFT